MKKLTLSLILAIAFNSTFGQIDSLIYVRLYPNNMLYESPDDNSPFVKSLEIVRIPIIGFEKGKVFEFYKIYYFGQIRYCFKSATSANYDQKALFKQISLSQKNLELAKANDDSTIRFFDSLRIVREKRDAYLKERYRIDSTENADRIKAESEKSERDSIENVKRIRESLKRAIPYGLGIIDYSMTSGSYSVGFDATIQNLSLKKRIKYVSFTITYYNAVDDPIKTYTVRMIGPILPGEAASVTFDNVCYSKVCSYVKIDKIQIEYFDGVKKILNKNDVKAIKM